MIKHRKQLESFLTKKTQTSKAAAAVLSDVALAQRVLLACGRKVASKSVAVAVAMRKLELETECARKRRAGGGHGSS
jgi:hypothetical protein